MGRRPKKQEGVDFPNRSVLTEKEVADMSLGDFVVEGSKGKMFIDQISTIPMTRAALITIAQTLATLAGIKFKRNSMRRVALVIKWFDENYDAILPFQHFIKLDFCKE